MPKIIPQPCLDSAAFVLHPPQLPPSLQARASRPVYSEEEMEQARHEARGEALRDAEAAFEEKRRALEAPARAAAQQCLDLARDLLVQRQALLREAAGTVVDFSLQVAHRVLRREIEIDSDAVVPTVRELLRRAANATSLTVRLSPRDYAHLSAHLDRVPEAAGLEGLRLRTDSSVQPGGCVLETEDGSLDARLETQMERITRALSARDQSPEDAASPPSPPPVEEER